MKWEDYFTKKAKLENFKSRAVYKLQEIDKHYKIFSRHSTVLDLGCSPGSWSQYVLQNTFPQLVMGIDMKTTNLTNSNFIFVQMKIEKPEDVYVKLKNYKFDVIINDMAPNTTGIKLVDQARSFELFSLAFNISKNMLKIGGIFVGKIFLSPEAMEFSRKLKNYFKKVYNFKPKSSRNKSTEVYIICKEKI